MRRVFLSTMIAALAFGSALPSSAAVGHHGAKPSDAQVTIAHWRFHPKTLTVPVGTTVVWLNLQHGNHTSISDDGLWNSHAIAPGATFSYTFTAAGTYPYHCRYGHGIHGVVVVQAASP